MIFFCRSFSFRFVRFWVAIFFLVCLVFFILVFGLFFCYVFAAAGSGNGAHVTYTQCVRLVALVQQAKKGGEENVKRGRGRARGKKKRREEREEKREWEWEAAE